MAVRLFNTNHHIITVAMCVLCFTDSQIDRFTLIVAMADHTACVVHNVPAIMGFVVVDVVGLIGAAFFRGRCHVSDHARLSPLFCDCFPPFLRPYARQKAYSWSFWLRR